MKRLKKFLRVFALIVTDALLVAFSFMCAFLLIYENFSATVSSVGRYPWVMPMFSAIFVLVLYCGRIYKTIWHYAGIREVGRIALYCLVASAFSFCSYELAERLFTENYDFPTKSFIVVPFFSFALITSSRYVMKWIMDVRHRAVKKTKSEVNGRIMIIGAGDGASLLLNNIHQSAYYKGVKTMCLIDDDPTKMGLSIHGVSVKGNRGDIVRLAKDLKIDIIIFCIPSCPSEEKAKILKICQKTGCKLKTLPSVYQIVNAGEISAKSVRNVEIEDLLGREPIKLNNDDVSSFVKDKVVMVTGGGGSIGSELCRQIAANHPKQLVIFDIYENNAYDIQNELKATYPDLNLQVRIGSVRDTRRIDQIFATFRPHIVYHAAAHKHVPLMEDSPNEAIKNNVFGTLKTVRAAHKYSVERFVLISTDKAVNPTNIMGASKRMCEMIIQAYNKKSETDFVAVRFGNVLGSNGSVVPLFKKQIAAGGPVTVTDPGIIRYFMTIPEAVSLVLKAGINAQGGEIFVLDMGEPVKILDLAENLISLSGFTPYVDIDIQFTGLRPGEKKFEELLMSEEGLTKTANKLIYIGKPIDFDEDAFLASLDEHKEEIYDDSDDIRTWVKKFVPTYHAPEK